ncbi:hypothetical protein [Roseovarius indicus]|uniref:Uncharacterized protein n=1 Tax=Roseovarius indicus TaxID=540747 RepID=A0A0T5P835_9RHOB|nr:hypothetical protein [Roseovarius indicus]KRS17506.1 hypothetical protein XM52_13570 [Roseovarius indicus]QEW26706.1 hypothetical protein RIdsm_02508 [Roseovarius indicus]SFD61333.1 hypothetical protein SAMN04488031_101834 [Roseovarius indicus]
MKPSNIELCSVAYHASSMSQNANAAYWLECSDVGADHLRKDMRKNLERIADLLGLKLVEVDDDTCSECGDSSDDLTEFQGSYLCENCTRAEADRQQEMHEMAGDDKAHAWAEGGSA